MICTLTARRVKSGKSDAFRDAFMSINEEVPEEILKRWTKVYVCRDVTYAEVMLTFGVFDGTLEQLREIQGQADGEGPADRVAELVDDVLLDGSYEVIEDITP